MLLHPAAIDCNRVETRCCSQAFSTYLALCVVFILENVKLHNIHVVALNACALAKEIESRCRSQGKSRGLSKLRGEKRVILVPDTLCGFSLQSN